MMKYTVKYSTLFKKSFKKCMKRGCSEDKFRKVISILSETGTLPPEYKPHPLKSNYKGCMECHITSDWLLIWKQNDKELILILTDTGTHSDIFGWQPTNMSYLIKCYSKVRISPLLTRLMEGEQDFMPLILCNYNSNKKVNVKAA